MNMPLSRFLTHFHAVPSPDVGIDPPPLEPQVTLDVADLEARLAATRNAALDEADAVHCADLAKLAAAHTRDVAEAVETARSEWAAINGADIATTLDALLGGLRETLSNGIAKVLRPLLAETVVDRTRAALDDALARLLADTNHPCLVARGPADLLAIIRASRPATGLIEYIEADTIEITVIADSTRIETRLGAALTAIAETEA